MLGKIKKVLGIEGVKVECKIFSVDKNLQKISGELKFSDSMINMCQLTPILSLSLQTKVVTINARRYSGSRLSS